MKVTAASLKAAPLHAALNVGADVVQIWSRNTPESGPKETFVLYLVGGDVSLALFPPPTPLSLSQVMAASLEAAPLHAARGGPEYESLAGTRPFPI